MSEKTFADLREEYDGIPLAEDAVADSPTEQFRRWFHDASTRNIRMANGMTLATATPDGRPSARIVLLKSYDERGFVFFTNYTSRKGQELEENRHAALLFWWAELDRQVRIEGSIERVSAEESNAYFASRPRQSNLSAMASPQSQPVPGREWLEDKVEKLSETWAHRELERPSHWGGYRVVPEVFEFWQGRLDRLHDRLRYVRHQGAWRLERLAP